MPESSLHFSVHVIDDHTVQVAMYIRLIQCKSVYFESYMQASKSVRTSDKTLLVRKIMQVECGLEGTLHHFNG